MSIDAGFAFSSARPASMKPYALAGTLDDAAKSFYQNLKSTHEEEIIRSLEGYLSQSAISDVLKRRKNLLEFMEKKYGL